MEARRHEPGTRQQVPQGAEAHQTVQKHICIPCIRYRGRNPRHICDCDELEPCSFCNRQFTQDSRLNEQQPVSRGCVKVSLNHSLLRDFQRHCGTVVEFEDLRNPRGISPIQLDLLANLAEHVADALDALTRKEDRVAKRQRTPGTKAEDSNCEKSPRKRPRIQDAREVEEARHQLEQQLLQHQQQRQEDEQTLQHLRTSLGDQVQEAAKAHEETDRLRREKRLLGKKRGKATRDAEFWRRHAVGQRRVLENAARQLRHARRALKKANASLRKAEHDGRAASVSAEAALQQVAVLSEERDEARARARTLPQHLQHKILRIVIHELPTMFRTVVNRTETWLKADRRKLVWEFPRIERPSTKALERNLAKLSPADSAVYTNMRLVSRTWCKDAKEILSTIHWHFKCTTLLAGSPCE